MKNPSRHPLCAGVLLLGLGSPCAWAQSPEGSVAADAAGSSGQDAKARAGVVFARGSAQYEAGDFRNAAASFELAHSIAPHSVALFNAAKAWLAAGEIERAADDYSESIRRVELSPDLNLEARRNLTILRRRLGWLVLTGPRGAKVSVGYQESASLPLEIHVPPGEHSVRTFLSDGAVVEEVVRVEADKPLSVFLAQPKEEPTPARVAEPGVEPSSAARKVQTTIAVSSLGVAGALGITAGVLGALTLDANGRYEDSGFTDADLKRETESLMLWTNIAAFSAGALGLTGGILLLTLPSDGSPSDESEPSTEARIELLVRPGSAYIHGVF